MIRKPSLVVAGLLAAVVAVSAEVIFNPETGAGFVGKGNVQLVFGWNNSELQNNAGSVQFRVNSAVVTEVSWICTNSNNEHIQERARTTTTAIQGVVSSVARVRNQVTGFNLTGYTGTPTLSSSTDGPALNSCPAAPSSWALTTPAGDPVVVSTTGGLEVSIGAGWFVIG